MPKKRERAEWTERDFWFGRFGCQDRRQVRHSRDGSGGDPLDGAHAEVRRRVTHDGAPLLRHGWAAPSGFDGSVILLRLDVTGAALISDLCDIA